MPKSSRDGSYVAALWEHPELVVALFGVQFHTPEGQQMYDAAGIGEEVDAALAAAEGLLLNRGLMTEEGPVSMQYWRSAADLERFARVMPHARWWKWLMQHQGEGLGFYHEIYGVKSAEAIFEVGTRPVGPAKFCSVETVTGGEGRSKERLARFAAAVDAHGGTASGASEAN